MSDKRVYIRTDTSGTYQGNGGFICLNELARQLARLGYAVSWFDNADRLRLDHWIWTGYDFPTIAPFAQVRADNAPIVTTWLYSWIDALRTMPDLWPRLRYWCSGELLRNGLMYNPSREFVRDHLREIAINNPTLTETYKRFDIGPRWRWTNWIRREFKPNPAVRQTGMIGFQPDDKNEKTTKALYERFGVERIILCTGAQREVALKMQLCDVYLSWNNHWALACGPGESFGLNAYEAMASGCAVVSRAHCGNTTYQGIVPRVETLDEALMALDELLSDEVFRGHARHQQGQFVEAGYRFDEPRQRAIMEYLNG